MRRRRACDTHVLQAMGTFAFTTAFSVPGCWAAEFYRRKRDEGHKHRETLRCLAHRWVKIIAAMWRDGPTYDEELHRANKRGEEDNNGKSA